MEDFEKLQIVKLHNKNLLKEIGVLQSEKAELEYWLKQSPDKSRFKKLTEEIKALRKTNRDLIEKFLR